MNGLGAIASQMQALQERAEKAEAALAAVHALAEPYTGQPDGYRHYYVMINGQAHLALLFEDLRAALGQS